MPGTALDTYPGRGKRMEKQKIIVIEPNFLNAKDMVNLLYPEHECRNFSYIHDALLACTDKKFDLVITAYDFPGIQGFAFLKLLRGLQPQAKIMVLTHYLNSNLVNECHLINASAIIHRPFSAITFCDKVKNVLADILDLNDPINRITPLGIRESIRNGYMVLNLTGELTRDFVHQLKCYLSRLMRRGIRGLALNFAGVTRADQYGMRLIAAFCRAGIAKMGKIVIYNVERFRGLLYEYLAWNQKIRILADEGACCAVLGLSRVAAVLPYIPRRY
jgi:CheY-like chemotaxis protein